MQQVLDEFAKSEMLFPSAVSTYGCGLAMLGQ